MIWFIKKKKKRSVFVYFKKIVFGEERKKKIRYVLLSKTKSFGSKYQIYFGN